MILKQCGFVNELCKHVSNHFVPGNSHANPLNQLKTIPMSNTVWHKTPGTILAPDLSVDQFTNRNGIACFFLTHFHSDHYVDITRWSYPTHGIIVCHEWTKYLILEKFPELEAFQAGIVCSQCWPFNTNRSQSKLGRRMS